MKGEKQKRFAAKFSAGTGSAHQVSHRAVHHERHPGIAHLCCGTRNTNSAHRLTQTHPGWYPHGYVLMLSRSLPGITCRISAGVMPFHSAAGPSVLATSPMPCGGHANPVNLLEPSPPFHTWSTWAETGRGELLEIARRRRGCWHARCAAAGSCAKHLQHAFVGQAPVGLRHLAAASAHGIFKQRQVGCWGGGGATSAYIWQSLIRLI